MDIHPNYEGTEAFEKLLDERIRSVQEHPEDLISFEEVLQEGWDTINERFHKDIQA